MWLFKVRSHHTTTSYWVRAGNDAFSKTKKRIKHTHHIEDWKWEESKDVFMSFPAFG